MKFGYVRAIAYATVVFVAAVALTFVPQLPDRRPAELFVTQAAVPSWKLRFDTLGKNETLQRVFRRAGMSDSAASKAIRAATMVNERKIRPDMPITFRTDTADSEPSEVVLEMAIDRLVRIKRVGAGWSSAEETLPWTTDTIGVSGTIQSSVWNAVDVSASSFLPKAGRELLTIRLAQDVYGFKIDMTRELQKGDKFTVVVERSRGPKGAVRIGKILATSFTLSGSTLKAVRFDSKGGGGDYFDETGKSMRAMFLRYPVDFSRISSGFGTRLHPILGYTRAHKGTDYAAEERTPVKAIGDGVVLRATWDNGYGNLVEIRHMNGYVTRYGHMRGFASGVHGGSRVTMSQVIGYVGHTGLATGPHLHFEVLIGGTQVNPQQAFGRTTGLPVPGSERAAFVAMRDAELPRLAEVPANSALALSSASPGIAVAAMSANKPH